MSRIRTIKPEFFQHEDLFDAEQETGLPLRVAFAGLWTQCDREGRFEWRPRRLKVNCLPFDDCDFSRVLHALATRGFVVHYASNGKEFGAIPSWRRHQVINNRERASEIPEPQESQTLSDASSTRADACPTPLCNAQGEGKGREGKGKERNEKDMSSSASAESSTARFSEIKSIFAYWQKACKHPRAKLDEKRRRAIRKALDLGYTALDLGAAIEGCKLSPFHSGENATGTVYDDLTLILRDADHIDKFIRQAESPGPRGLSEAGRASVAGIQEWLDAD